MPEGILTWSSPKPVALFLSSRRFDFGALFHFLINVAKSSVECGIFHTHLQKEFKALQKVLKVCSLFESLKDPIFVGFDICAIIIDPFLVPES